MQLENVNREELKKRIADMGDFLKGQPTAITEYDESLVRRLIGYFTQIAAPIFTFGQQLYPLRAAVVSN